MHLDSIVDFVNPRGFGYVSPEKQLFGFQPHHFRKIPASNRWQVRSVELVSLILNKEPKVYVTVELPRMDKVRNVPTRALDEFEKTGLSKLRSGDDLFVCETPVGIRMLGAIRSLKLCVECHDGEPGNLLGAFSYGLVPR